MSEGIWVHGLFFARQGVRNGGYNQASMRRFNEYAAQRKAIWAEERRAREEKWLKRERGELDDCSTGV